MIITIKNLINRIDVDEQFLKQYPDKKEMLEKRIQNTKELIVQSILQNRNNEHITSLTYECNQ